MLRVQQKGLLQSKFGLPWIIVLVLFSSPLLIYGYEVQPSFHPRMVANRRRITSGTFEDKQSQSRGGPFAFKELPHSDNCFDDDEFNEGREFFDEFGFDDKNAAQNVAQNSGKLQYLRERAERCARLQTRLARREVRKSPAARGWLAASVSDFATLLSFGLLAAAAPFTLDAKAADSLRVALFGALNNATTDALEQQGNSTAATAGNPERIAMFVLRNALVPAALHRAVNMAAEVLVKDAETAEEHVAIQLQGLVAQGLSQADHLLASFSSAFMSALHL
jgi:hypothetical protein